MKYNSDYFRYRTVESVTMFRTSNIHPMVVSVFVVSSYGLIASISHCSVFKRKILSLIQSETRCTEILKCTSEAVFKFKEVLEFIMTHEVKRCFTAFVTLHHVGSPFNKKLSMKQSINQSIN